MDGKIEDEVNINIRPASSLLKFTPDYFQLRKSPQFIGDPAFAEAEEILDQFDNGVGNQRKLRRLNDLEAYLTSIAIDFKEAFEEYKSIYNEFHELYSKKIQAWLRGRFSQKRIKYGRKTQKTSGERC